MIHYENLKLYLRIGLKLKQYVDFNLQNIIGAEKNGEKERNALCELISNYVYGKTTEN